MAPSPSPDDLDPAERDALLDVALAAIEAGLDTGVPTQPDTAALPERLRRPGAAFVTVRVDGALNGCIGTMEPREPLAEVVGRMAWEAAFADPRLPVLRPEQLADTHIEVSVLSPMEPVPAATREQLLSAITPGVHGVWIESGFAHATLLPAVWREVPDPERFLDLLLHKAGLRQWPIGLRAFRYTATEFGRDARPATGPGA